VKAANKDNADKMQSSYLTAESINRQLRVFDLPPVMSTEVQYNNSKEFAFGRAASVTTFSHGKGKLPV